MIDEKRREPRVTGEFVILLSLRNSLSGEIIAGPVEGIMTNFSGYGAAIALDKIRIDGHHLFYSAQDEPSVEMLFDVTEEFQGENSFLLVVKPIWYDTNIESSKQFRVGVEFSCDDDTEKLKKLDRMLKDLSHTNHGWLKTFFSKLQNVLTK